MSLSRWDDQGELITTIAFNEMDAFITPIVDIHMFAEIGNVPLKRGHDVVPIVRRSGPFEITE